MLVHGATLNGIVNPGNAETTVTFEYGLDTNYGSIVTLPSTINGEVDIPVSAEVQGLEASTLIYFRVKAVNSVGQAVGAYATFTTLADSAVIPTAVTQPATNIT